MCPVPSREMWQSRCEQPVPGTRLPAAPTVPACRWMLVWHGLVVPSASGAHVETQRGFAGGKKRCSPAPSPSSELPKSVCTGH